MFIVTLKDVGVNNAFPHVFPSAQFSRADVITIVKNVVEGNAQAGRRLLATVQEFDLTALREN